MNLTKLSLVLLPILFNCINALWYDCFNPIQNACKSWLYYDKRCVEETLCFKNPDVDSTAEEIITANGFTSETFTIQSKDFELQLIEIKIPSGVNPIRKSVIFVHGMTMDSTNWLFQGKGSLPFILAIKGYGVWLLDLRGTLSSKSTYDTTNIKYWQRITPYLMHYDVEAAVQKVHEVNNQEIIIIAYSMGTTASVTLAAVKPSVLTVNQVIRLILMAPAIYFHGSTSILALGGTDGYRQFSKIAKQNKQYSFGAPSDSSRKITQLLFLQQTPNVAFFWNVNGRVLGYSCYLNPETIAATLLNGRAPMSIYTLDFFAQSMRTEEFYALDYEDPALNIEHYGTSEPPTINLANIKVEVFAHSSNGDILATSQGSQKLVREIASTNAYYLPLDDELYSHLDFISFVGNPTGLYQHIFEYSLQGIAKGIQVQECTFPCPFQTEEITDDTVISVLGQM